jgi:hypothetical protein
MASSAHEARASSFAAVKNLAARFAKHAFYARLDRRPCVLESWCLLLEYSLKESIGLSTDFQIRELITQSGAYHSISEA